MTIRTYSRPSRLYSKTALLGIAVCILVIVILANNNYSQDSTFSIMKHLKGVMNSYEAEFEKRMELSKARARFDNGRLIRIYDYVRVGKDWTGLTNQYDICLATQTSIEHLYWLPQVLKSWFAPLSLALFLMDEKEWLVFNLYSNYLERCYPQITKSVSIHIVLPTHASGDNFSSFWNNDYTGKWNVTSILSESLEKPCGDDNEAKDYLQYLLAMFGIPTVWQKDELANKVVYPQNHMRNIARKTCPTAWTYSVDVDIIPRTGMAEMLQRFYDDFSLPERKSCKKCAFIIPTFELDVTAKRVPTTKKEMVAHFKNGTATQLNLFFEPAQFATDYESWTSSHLEETMTQISHDIILNRTESFEPFYVSSDEIPAFDERFLGYGRTRSSQESLLAGWSFKVLTPVFAIHWGIHKPFDKPVTIAEEVRWNQTLYNMMLFDKIWKEMKFKQAEDLL